MQCDLAVNSHSHISDLVQCCLCYLLRVFVFNRSTRGLWVWHGAVASGVFKGSDIFICVFFLVLLPF